MDPEDVDRQAFIQGYTSVLVNAWSDSSYCSRLEKDPVSAVLEVGLEVPEGLHIDLVREEAREDDRTSSECLDEQYQMWLEGLSSGVARLHVPQTPVVTCGTLTLEDLESVSGGGAVMCCCCPCSCSV